MKSIALLAACLLFSIHSASAGWKIPTPQTTEHPGAENAPASSPATYPDAEGFQKRAEIIVKGLATNDFASWRQGYFSGGDPGKYLPGAAMAKLLLDPADLEARKYMNDERSPKEHYHFAAVNWARFLPLFGDALTPETRAELATRAARYSDYLKPTGTENHRTMSLTSAVVLPHYLEGERFSNEKRVEAPDKARDLLKRYVKGLYAAGQGEWDSSTYLMFDLNGMLNIYDFSPDPEARLLAKAALDWFAAGYALKYRDGVYTAPNQRGFAAGPVKSIADQTGWLWWGSHAEITPEMTNGFLFTIAPITSGWRPSEVIHNIATKKLPSLPFESRNTKPNYWFGGQKTPSAGEYAESVYVTQQYTLGSLWNGFGGQMTRMQLVAESPAGGIVFTGGHPRRSDHTGKIENDVSYADGNGRYDQSAQFGSAYISMSRIPEDEELDYSFFSIPEGATKPVLKGGWWVMQAGETLVGVRGLCGDGEVAESTLSDKQEKARAKALEEGNEPKAKPQPILRFAGRPTGFVLETATTAKFATVDAFAAALEALEIDTSKFRDTMEVSLTTLDGASVRARHQEGKDRAAVSVNGEPVVWDGVGVYEGPYIRQKDGVLSVNDGTSGFTVDFTGESPVYKAWAK